ncbi:hypothetical protein PG987_005190 [Apiospora arundinis]
MQFQTLAATAFFAALAAAAPQAQQPGGLIAGLPTCALPCFQEGSVKVGCTAGDFACVCTKLDAFTKESAGCIAAACKPEDLLTLQSASTQLCKAALAGASSSSAAAPAAPSATASASAPAKASSSASASAPAAATPSASGTPKTAGGSRAEAGAMLAVAAAVAMAL